jgi:hypothetical protein
MNPIIHARAVPRARWALKQTRRGVLASIFEVDETRVSHRMRDGDNCAADFYAVLADPLVDAAPLMAGAFESYEERLLQAEPAVLRARLDYLMLHEHDREARQNRALMQGRIVSSEVRAHHSALGEMLAIGGVLGMEEDG